MNNPTFLGQTLVLVKKNLVITIKRKWFSTIIRSLVLPIVLLVLLLEIQNFSKDPNRYGIGPPHPIKSLQDSLKGSKPIVISLAPTLGLDFPPVLDRFEKALGDHKVIYVDEDQLDSTCPVDYHGRSPCHAAILFTDSPGSGNVNATWAYDIRTEPALESYNFNVFDTNSAAEGIIIPLQLAIENAITNSTEIPDIQAYTADTQDEADESSRRNFQVLALYILSFVFFFTMVPVAHHVAGLVTYDRESGMSQLIDAMSGSGAVWSRVLSTVITFDLLYLPLWIILGAVFWHLLLPGQNAGVVIFWQIFTGWSVTSASIFGAAFFKRHAFGSLFVSLIAILLAVLAAYTENLRDPASIGQVVILSLLFPSMNYVYFFSVITKAEILGHPLTLGTPLSGEELRNFYISGQGGRLNWVSVAGSYFLWIILVVQIVGFPLLAVLVEKVLYGNNRKGRDFDTSPEAVNSQVAIQTNGLSKLYRPSWLRKIFCCARTPKTKAVDNLDLASYRHQILCLLGPNGSGKTTTLDMLSGFQRPTGGSITINASPSQIGICPQKNVLWDNLTVSEHVAIWAALKGGGETPESLEKLIEQCDLTKKKNSMAGSLSGGTKRKLQLACMLVGGSSICFADEITSGLDPLSRRVIWEVIKRERAKRTIVLTTHFLDESEVLADHIVIVTLGKMKCQGTPAELKNKYGGGYRVHIPKTEDISSIAHSVIERDDRYICRTPDSSSAAQVLASLKTSKDSELYITGPTIEDVFLKVAEEPHTLIGETLEDISVDESLRSETKPTEQDLSLASVYARQIRAFLIKRIVLLRSTWWQYLFALAIPIIVSHFIGPFLKFYKTPDCTNLIANEDAPYRLQLYSLYGLAFGPKEINDTLTAIIVEQNEGYVYSGYSSEEYGPFIVDSRQELENFIHTHSQNISYNGAFWVGNNSKPLIAYDPSGTYSGQRMLNIANRLRSGVKIEAHVSEFTSYNQANGGNSVTWITIFCLVQALYPAFFSLYPTYERRSQVRALQYSNGIRPFSTIFSYWVFDSFFVIIVAAVCTALISSQAQWFGIGYLFLVQALYGFAAILFAYLISFIARSQPSAFAFSVLFMAIMYVLSIITILVINLNRSGNQVALDGTAYGLGLIFPIQNLLRAFTVSLNTYIVRCRGRSIVSYAGSIYAYGGPILLLVLQIIWLFVLLLWLEGARLPILSKPKVIPHDAGDAEKIVLSGRPDVDAETARVMSSESDLLRVQHVSKNFGSFSAVEDVSLGLQKGEILALLGPNGAGKTTTINMIRGDLSPSSGKIYLQDVDVHKNTRLAQNNLGVCPQFDALDLLTVREHLSFYSRCKGVADVKADVAYVMSKVGITAHADKLAAKLSGGNKRKLSLGIALVGNPPVLLLDEPSSAMDAASKRVLWKTLEAVAPGRSVLITTHSMEEADALATRAAIIAKRLLAIGTTEALRKTHSNEYHVHLILKSAPLSTPGEMREVADWVRDTFPGIKFEGENLGGQVRFIVPADSKVPVPQRAQSEGIEGGAPAQSFTRYLIDTLEARKEELGLDCYSISAATMESVFLRVVKESDAEEDERVVKKPWWRW